MKSSSTSIPTYKLASEEFQSLDKFHSPYYSALSEIDLNSKQNRKPHSDMKRKRNYGKHKTSQTKVFTTANHRPRTSWKNDIQHENKFNFKPKSKSFRRNQSRPPVKARISEPFVIDGLAKITTSELKLPSSKYDNAASSDLHEVSAGYQNKSKLIQTLQLQPDVKNLTNDNSLEGSFHSQEKTESFIVDANKRELIQNRFYCKENQELQPKNNQTMSLSLSNETMNKVDSSSQAELDDMIQNQDLSKRNPTLSHPNIQITSTEAFGMHFKVKEIDNQSLSLSSSSDSSGRNDSVSHAELDEINFSFNSLKPEALSKQNSLPSRLSTQKTTLADLDNLFCYNISKSTTTPSIMSTLQVQTLAYPSSDDYINGIDDKKQNRSVQNESKPCYQLCSIQ